ncbi:Uma2 family endonuclease [Synechococcus sp. PCC 7336]|uniref:Uma2 family endonuclease n=1 Tax=Synechococcus sp. PCC 7336 TaxID=195250 RepID=UPI000476138B|nr:Uma2 family endonuclease [Synechococcus sp. PCC 7336]
MLATELRERLKFTAARYELTTERGVLTQSDRVELIEGEIVEMAPISPPHNSCTDLLTERFVLALAGKAIVRVQGAVRLSDRSMPEPDLAILKYCEDRYRDRRPTPRDIYALVEVSDSTSDYDRMVKLPLYARANIAEYWILDVKAEKILVHRQPNGDRYGDYREYSLGESISLLAFPEIKFSVASLLP